MALYIKCLRCGGWREMPEDPTEENEFPTGMVKSFPEPPANPCSCDDEAGSKGE